MPPDADIPRQIGRYNVERLLGSGAMGFVFLGADPELDRPVAIKTVRDLGMDSASMQTFLERFRNEARAAARLAHPHIVQVYDVGEDPEWGPYLVFEYIAGSTLKQILRAQGPLSPEKVVQLAEEIGDALSLAHTHDIIHRDLKPENLLVQPNGRAKLADFGIARVPDALLTREGQFLGTPCYAAPETISGAAYSPQSDLFSFAAVMYEAISGQRAFPGDDALSVAQKVLHDVPPPPSAMTSELSAVPPEVDDVIMEGLSKNPGDRLESAADFAAALRAAYEDAGYVVTEESSRPGSRRFPLEAKRPKKQSSNIGFVFVLISMLGLGVGLIYALDRAISPDVGPEDSAEEDDTVDDTESSDDPSTTRRPRAIATTDDRDATPKDAGSGDSGKADAASDAATPLQALTSRHDREEAAKDALAEARRHLAAGKHEQAQRALDKARAHDPENPDIDALAQKLREAVSKSADPAKPTSKGP